MCPSTASRNATWSIPAEGSSSLILRKEANLHAWLALQDLCLCLGQRSLRWARTRILSSSYFNNSPLHIPSGVAKTTLKTVLVGNILKAYFNWFVFSFFFLFRHDTKSTYKVVSQHESWDRLTKQDFHMQGFRAIATGKDLVHSFSVFPGLPLFRTQLILLLTFPFCCISVFTDSSSISAASSSSETSSASRLLFPFVPAGSSCRLSFLPFTRIFPFNCCTRKSVQNSWWLEKVLANPKGARV